MTKTAKVEQGPDLFYDLEQLKRWATYIFSDIGH